MSNKTAELIRQSPSNVRRARVLLLALGDIALAALPTEAILLFTAVRLDLGLLDDIDRSKSSDEFRHTVRDLAQLVTLAPEHKDLFFRVIEVLGYTDYANSLKEPSVFAQAVERQHRTDNRQ